MRVACAVITENSRVLVTQRPPHKSRGGKWEFPGGKIHTGETPEVCIVRELMEELDVNVTVLSLIHTLSHSYTDLTIELTALHCRIRDGNITLHEHTSYLWASAEELMALDVCEADLRMIPHVLKLL